MVSQSIISLAVLKVNWDTLKKDYLENFVPMVIECIRLSESDVISLGQLQDDVNSRFGLNIPQNVIKLILNRIKKRKYICIDHGIYKRITTSFDQTNFHETQQKVLRMHESVVNNLLKFSSDLGLSWEQEDSEQALQTYINENQFPILVNGEKYPELVPPASHSVKNAKFVIAKFIKYLIDTHSSDFDYFKTIVKGNLLANAIYLSDPNKANKKFHNTSIFFDTSFLLYSLGYAGEARKAPCAEFLSMLYSTNADLKCFRHTFEEMHGILDRCASLIRSGKIKDSYGPSMEYFISTGVTESDILLLMANLERNLNALHIRVVEKPEYCVESLINEAGLDKELTLRVGYLSDLAKQRDVDSISAVMRLRRGLSSYEIEECKALFVSTNYSLVATANRFLADESTSSSIGPAILDCVLTNRLWLKTPLQAPNFPEKRIIADCYAAMQPSADIWKKYLDKIESLKSNNFITTEDYYLLRHSLEAKEGLMDLTHGDNEVFTEGTVPEVLSVVKSTIIMEEKAKLEQETKCKNEAERKFEDLTMAERDRLSRIRSNSVRIGGALVVVIEAVIAIILVYGMYSTLPWDLPSIKNVYYVYALSIVQTSVLLFCAYNLFFGVTINSYLRQLENMIANSVERFILNIS